MTVPLRNLKSSRAANCCAPSRADCAGARDGKNKTTVSGASAAKQREFLMRRIVPHQRRRSFESEQIQWVHVDKDGRWWDFFCFAIGQRTAQQLGQHGTLW